MSLAAQCPVSWFQFELTAVKFWTRQMMLHNLMPKHKMEPIMRGDDTTPVNGPTGIRADCRAGLIVDDIIDGVRADARAFGKPVGMVFVDYSATDARQGVQSIRTVQ